MDRLRGLHDDLRDTLAEKLERMRTADIDGVGRLIEQEQRLLGRIAEQEGLRKQIMEQLGRKFGMSAAFARTLPATRLAERLDATQGERLLTQAKLLKTAVQSVAVLNKMVNDVSTKVLEHMKDVFASITNDQESNGAYSYTGQTVVGRPRELFEAIG
jgi:FlgN protein